MRYRRLESETTAELHAMAQNANYIFAAMITAHEGTSPETLRYLVRKEVFQVPVLAQQPGEDTFQKINLGTKKNIWSGAVYNSALSTDDLIWIYENVVNSIPHERLEELTPKNLKYEDILIFKGIGVHRNTPKEIVTSIKTMRLNGHLILLKNDFVLRDEREIEQKWINLRKRQGLFDNMVPSLPSNPNALPTKENGGLLD